MGLAKTGARGHGQGLLTMGGGGVTSIEEEHSDRSSDMGGTRRGWLAAIAQASRADGFWLAVVLALLSCLPVVVAQYPQMSDYPAHLARYHVMLDAGRSADLARYYTFEWKWTGNVGVDLLIRPFAAVFGLELGGRVICGLIPPLTGLGILAVEIALRRRLGIGALLAFAFIWSPMMLIGLLNYALGQALALWCFALWVALDRRSSHANDPSRDGSSGTVPPSPIGEAAKGDQSSPPWRGPLFVPLGVVVWLCHLSAWGMLGIMVFGYEWARRKHPETLFKPWPLLAPLAIMMFSKGTSGDFSYGAYWWIYKQAIWLKAMRDTWYPLDFLGEVLVASAIILAVIWHRIDARLGWAAGIMLALSIALPRHISGGDYADYRMVTSGLMVGCLAIDWQPAATGIAAKFGRAMVLLGAPALYLARLAVTTLSWQADSATTAQILLALDHMPRGSKIASAVLIPRDNWGLDHFEHIGAYAVVRNDALVNANFAVAHIHMLHLKVPFYSDPSHRIMQMLAQKLDLAHFAPATDPRVGAQYLWYVGIKTPDTLPPGTVVWRGQDTLVERLQPVASQPSVAAPLAKSDKSL